MTEEQRSGIRLRAAWLAHDFVKGRQRTSTFTCDECGFDPIARTNGTPVRPRSLLDVHHLHPLEEGIRVTTLADFALLCPIVIDLSTPSFERTANDSRSAYRAGERGGHFGHRQPRVFLDPSIFLLGPCWSAALASTCTVFPTRATFSDKRAIDIPTSVAARCMAIARRTEASHALPPTPRPASQAVSDPSDQVGVPDIGGPDVFPCSVDRSTRSPPGRRPLGASAPNRSARTARRYRSIRGQSRQAKRTTTYG